MTDTAEEELDSQIKQLDEELKGSSYGSPESIPKESLFKFFNRILDLDNTTKVANLSSQELGVMKLGVRSYKEIAAYAEIEGLDKVAEYLRNKSEILSSTSMSKKGFWSQLFVTQIKKEQKMKEPEKKKEGLFSRKKGDEE